MKSTFHTSALKTFVAACAVSATVLTPMAASTASADGWRRGSNNGVYCGNHGCGTYHVPRYSRNHNDGSAAAAAILGIAGAAIIAGALAQPPAPRTYYVQPDAYPPVPAPSGPRIITYESTLEPWSPGWFAWCDKHYRSFDPHRGTFRGYDGLDHFCVPR